MTEHLLLRAKTGDGEAFRELVEPYRRELHVHCYRIVGSVQDAEDALQETLLAAWRGLDRFEGRSSMRTWLYRVATNRCLNMLRADSRRIREQPLPSASQLPEPTQWAEPSWIEPYPDLLLEELPEQAPGPEGRFESKESISLAFVTAMQSLPPRQRTALVLRDVLGFRTREAAEIMETTEEAVAAALKRARAAMDGTLPRDRGGLPDRATERRVAAQFAEAFERGDVDAVLALLTDEAWLRMPPMPMEYQGAEKVGRFLESIVFSGSRRYRLIPTRANGQPAYGTYVYHGDSPIGRAHGIFVISVEGDRVSAISRYLDNSIMAYFGFPRTLPDDRGPDRR